MEEVIYLLKILQMLFIFLSIVVILIQANGRLINWFEETIENTNEMIAQAKSEGHDDAPANDVFCLYVS